MQYWAPRVTERRGRPVASEVFPGDLHDEQTLPDRLAALRERFGCERLGLCVDRGTVTEAKLAAIGAAGFVFVTALEEPQVKPLAKQGDLQLSLLDELDLAEIYSAEFRGERLVVCRNPLVGAERARKREALLAVTEAELDATAVRVEWAPSAARPRSDSRSARFATATGCRGPRPRWTASTSSAPASATTTTARRQPRAPHSTHHKPSAIRSANAPSALTPGTPG